jgi:hypothetical protein
MTDYGRLGTQVMMRRSAPRAYAQARPGHPVVGWTPPTVIYDKMRHVDMAAKEMNALILANVRSTSLRSAWVAWYDNWENFFEKYQGTFAKLGAVFYTDDLARQAEDYRRTFESFRATYAAERDDKGQPLPPPIAPIPAVLQPGDTKKEEEKKGWSLPWWVWVMGGAGVVVGGYFIVKSVRNAVAEAKAKRLALEGNLPKLMEHYGIPSGVSQAATAHAPSGDPPRPPTIRMVEPRLLAETATRDASASDSES